MELTINQPFRLEDTLGCGQGHRWLARGGGWHEGVVGTDLITIRQTPTGLEFAGASDEGGVGKWLHRHFRFGDDVEAIHRELAQRDPVIAGLMENHAGVRVMRVDPWECLGFFILSANNNIPRIQRDMERIASAFGEPTGGSRSTFPGPVTLGRDSALGELEALKLGLNKHGKLHQAARAVTSGRLDLEALAAEPSHRLVTGALRPLYGVGDKVVNCIALFSLEQLDAFPVDIHVSRSLARHYRDVPKSPEALRRWGQLRFGRYAGYAEAFLFFDDWNRTRSPGPLTLGNPGDHSDMTAGEPRAGLTDHLNEGETYGRGNWGRVPGPASRRGNGGTDPWTRYPQRSIFRRINSKREGCFGAC